MKFTKSFLASLVLIAFTACNNDNEPGSVQINEVRSVSVTLKLPVGNPTKFSGPVDQITSSTVDVNSVLINLTDAGGAVMESVLVNKSTDFASDWVKLTTDGEGLKFINTPSSVTKVEVYGNPGSAVNSSNVVVTKVEDQQGSAVLYYGYDDDLTPVLTEPINPDPTNGTTYTAVIEIAPIVARMQVKSISFKAPGKFTYTREINGVQKEAEVTWDGFTADVVGVYFNNFYHEYNKPGTLTDLMNNLTYQNTIYNGLWIFPDLTPTIDATNFAAYIDYDGGYQPLPLKETDKAYAFNFFPGSVVPTIHIDLANPNIVNLESTNEDVFNPIIVKKSRFANIPIFYESNGVVPMTAADFKAGTIYNMDIEIIPALDTDLENVQYNVLVYVTIAPWVEETITPGFDLSE